MVVLIRGDYMRTATRNKLNEIMKLIKAGSTEKDIVKTKFARNLKQMREWVEKISPDLTFEEKQLLSFKENKLVVKSTSNLPLEINFKALQLLEDHEKRLKDLENKLEDSLKEKIGEVELLLVNDDILRLKSTVRSVRVNIDLMAEFGLIADKNLKYSKTNLLNQAILEFVEKYK